MNNGYLTYMDYAATGEGFTLEINFCGAENKEEAIEKHLDKFIGNDPMFKPSREYFRRGIAVHPIESDEAKKIFMDFFVGGEDLHRNISEAGVEMNFKVYYNHS